MEHLEPGVWLTIEKAGLRNALQSWSNVADLRFNEVATGGNLVEGHYHASAGDLGYHQTYENYSSSTVLSYGGTLSGAFNLNGYGWDEGLANGGLSIGGLGYLTLVHEIGHALGLDHTHGDSDDPHAFPGVDLSPFTDQGDNSLNQDIYSVMSYVHGYTSKPLTGTAGGDSYGYVAGPMAFDIAAIQFLYGANTTYRTGSDIYVLPTTNAAGTYYTCIWDAGGIDTIVHNGAAVATIDLRAATLNNEVGGGGFLSRVAGIYGGFTIANGVIIENATGGSGNDRICGNAAANHLMGGGGADQLYGQEGNDTVLGDAGDDTLEGGAGEDVLYGGAENDLLRGGIGGDTLYGEIGDDRMGGKEDNDLIYGDDGNDSLWGDAGDDTLEGGAGADVLYGGVDNDLLRGGIGGDTLYGEIGDDRMGGKEGDDLIYGDEGNDSLWGDAGDDTLEGGAGADVLYGGINNDVLRGGIGGDTLCGGIGDDRLGGKEDNDLICGDDGNDALWGDAGDDTLWGGVGNDTIYGNDGYDHACFYGVTSAYEITNNHDSSWVILEKASGFRDQLDGIERVAFDDGFFLV